MILKYNTYISSYPRNYNIISHVTQQKCNRSITKQNSEYITRNIWITFEFIEEVCKICIIIRVKPHYFLKPHFVFKWRLKSNSACEFVINRRLSLRTRLYLLAQHKRVSQIRDSNGEKRGNLRHHVWHVDGVGGRSLTIASHIGESGKIRVLISQPGTLTWFEQPDLVYALG